MRNGNAATWTNLVVDSLRSGIIVSDVNGVIRFANAAISTLTGYLPKELTVYNISDITDLHPDVVAGHALLEAGSWSGTTNLRSASGTVIAIHATASAVVNSQGQMFVIVSLADGDESPLQEGCAGLDELTGLITRAEFCKRIRIELKKRVIRKRSVTLLLIDIDRLNSINGSFGYRLGDALLVEVARRLRQIENQILLSRMGGDEFAVVLQGDEKSDIAAMVERAVDVLRMPIIVSGHEIFISASVGVNVCWSSPEDVDRYLEEADIALYRAKELGGDAYQMYQPDMAPHGGVEIETRLHKALANREFLLYYQPQFDISSGEITGMEVLLRWYNPDLGLVSPSVFIPMAERTGMIVPIGGWVLETACQQRKAWLDDGFDKFRIAVNLSARQFQKRDLVAMIDRLLRDTGLPARYLELEITESIAMTNVDQAFRTLHELELLGVRVSIDDFGTGYSSLGYLKRFPIHTLKIDQSFMRDVPDAADGSAIARAIITLAHSLKLNVIAEGVETREQLSFLYEHDCDEMQGYLLSKPLPLDAAHEYLRQLRDVGIRCGTFSWANQ